ncbi:MAG TPA: trehalose synthase, partial [Thermoanaerobaculia bacterium]|nr:trehalose synthase [Thermoanaerobaculia bacterium]
IAVHNTDEKPHRVTIRIPDRERSSLINLLSEGHSDGDGSGTHKLAIEGYGYRWYRVGGLDYILKRKKE